MTDYAMKAEEYKRFLARDLEGAAKERVDRIIKTYTMLGETDELDRMEMFSSGAFNEIVFGYILLAADSLQMNKKEALAILEAVGLQLGSVNAMTAVTRYNAL